MSENTRGQNLKETLFYKKKSVFEVKSREELAAAKAYAEGYAAWLDQSKTEREAVKAGIALLEVCGLRDAYPEIVSCPTCARTEYDLIGMASRVEEFIASLKASGCRIGLKKIAVMGCVVNGPGEAKDAEFGLAGSKNGHVALFRRGVPFANLPQEEAFEHRDAHQRLRRESDPAE